MYLHKGISIKLIKKLFFVGILRSLTIRSDPAPDPHPDPGQRYGSEDPYLHPDPYQNVTDPEHWSTGTLLSNSSHVRWRLCLNRPDFFYVTKYWFKENSLCVHDGVVQGWEVLHGCDHRVRRPELQGSQDDPVSLQPLLQGMIRVPLPVYWALTFTVSTRYLLVHQSVVVTSVNIE